MSPTAPDSDSPSGSPADGALRPAFVVALLLASSLAQSIWLADRGSPPNDEGALLTHAARIRDGAVFYRDLDSYPFPAAAYLLAAAMSITGEHLATARGLAALVYGGVVASLYWAALPFLGRRRAALFGLLLLGFKLLAWPAFTSYMYSDLAFAFACAATAVVVRSTPGARRRLVVAGVLVGLCLTAKQNLGIYLAAGLFCVLLLPRIGDAGVRDRALDAVGFSAGVAMPVIAMLGYFAAKGVLPALLYSGLVRPFTGYAPTSSVSFWVPLEWWRLGQLQGAEAAAYSVFPWWWMLGRGDLGSGTALALAGLAGELVIRCLYTALPIVFGAAAWRVWRMRGQGALDPPRWAFCALAVAALAALGSAFPRADAFHVLSVYPLPLLLGLAVLGRSADRRRPLFDRALLATAITALLVTTLVLVRFDRRLTVRIEVPRAAFRVAESQAWMGSVAAYLAASVPADQPLFVYGNEAYFYFLADRYPPWPFPQLYPGQAGADGGRALVERLDAQPPPWIVKGQLGLPGLPGLGTYTPALRHYLREHYTLDEEVFVLHPLAVGEPPRPNVLAVMRRRAAPGDR